MARSPSPWPTLAVVATALLLTSCSDSEPTGIVGEERPSIDFISPASESVIRSPIRVTVRGRGFEGASVRLPEPLEEGPVEVTGTSIRFDLSFAGAGPGPYWIRVETGAGRDSVLFTVEAIDAVETMEETRALWVSRFEYSSSGEVVEAVSRAAGSGFNVVFLQVRGRADAFYRSEIEPWSHRLTGTLGGDPGWDPLALAVSEAARHGVELHAWINAFVGWGGEEPPPESTPRHAFLEHPEWVMVDAAGEAMPYGRGLRWLTPGHPGVRSRLAAVAADIARRYGVDGIHLDFARYPDPSWSYDPASLAAYDSAKALEPALDFAEMRRRFVTWSVAETGDSVSAAAPGARLTAAVWGIYRNEPAWSSVSTGYGTVLQDARAWDRAGLVEALVPMVYWQVRPVYGSRLDFAYLADEHAAGIDGPAWIGIYVPPLDGRALRSQIERARLAGAEGISLFSYSALEAKGLWGELRDGAFRWPAEPAVVATTSGRKTGR